MTISPRRRCLLGALSTAFALTLLRPLIAVALCTRGDEFLRSGEPAIALHYYRVAIVSDPDCETAAERFVFASLEIHTKPVLNTGIRVADAYLLRHADEAIRIDRALALWSTNDFPRAAKELRMLGTSMHDQRFTRLAQIATLRAKRSRQ